MITNTKRNLFGQIFIAILCVLLFILFFMNSSYVIEAIQSSIILCTQTIIPSLFPYYILSELIISSSISNLLCKSIGKPLRVIFGVSEMSFYPIAIGTLCGFPIGAKLTASLLDNGCITKKEAERTVCLCSNPSPTFLINVVGLSFYFNKKLGVILWIITLLSTFIIGISYNLLFGPTFKKNIYTNALNSKITISKISYIIGESIYPVLKTCAYIIFFSSLMGCLKNIAHIAKINKYALAILYGTIELSGGAKQISTLSKNILSICLLSYAIGWAGLSVHLQTVSICQSQGIGLKHYFLTKLLQGGLNIFLTLIAYKITPNLFNVNQNTIYIPSFYETCIPIIQNWILIIFSTLTLIYLHKKCHKTEFNIIY